MIRIVTMDVYIASVIAALIIGGLITFTLMCCFIVGGDSDRKDEHDEERR